jgi:hypothetical protein
VENVITWGALALAVGSILSILTFWTRYSDRITKAEAKAAEADKAAQSASIHALGLQAEIKIMQRDFADYREAAALKFVSNNALASAENRFTGLVEEIKRDIRGVTERLDRVLDKEHK